jgi:hypothetical protein
MAMARCIISMRSGRLPPEASAVRVAGQVLNLENERQGRPCPGLMMRSQLPSLIDRSNPDANLAVGTLAPERRATAAAEELVAWLAAVADLPVTASFAGGEAEAAGKGGGRHTIGRPRQTLAIRAMADADSVSVYLSFIADSAALAGTGDLHGRPSDKETPGAGGPPGERNLTAWD